MEYQLAKGKRDLEKEIIVLLYTVHLSFKKRGIAEADTVFEKSIVGIQIKLFTIEYTFFLKIRPCVCVSNQQTGPVRIASFFNPVPCRLLHH